MISTWDQLPGEGVMVSDCHPVEVITLITCFKGHRYLGLLSFSFSS